MAVYKILGILDAKVGYVSGTNKVYEDVPYVNAFDNSTNVTNITFEGDNTQENVFSDAELTGTLGFDKLSDTLIQNVFGKKLWGTGGTTVGSVAGVTVTAGGSGYTGTPTVAFTAAPGGGRTATGTVVVTGGVVTAVNLTDPGSGYLVAPTPTISGGGGTGATATSSLATLPAGIDKRIYMGDNTEFASRTVELVVTARAVDEAAGGDIVRNMILTIPKANLSPFQPGNLANKAKQSHQFQWTAKKTTTDILGKFFPEVPADGVTYILDFSQAIS